MNYQAAKAYAENLNQALRAAALSPAAYPRNAMGVVNDAVRLSPEYQAHKKAYDRAFAELRNFNGWYVKTFRAEMRADRAAKLAANTI